MEPVQKKIYPPLEVGDYYNRVMPVVVQEIDIKDTMQGCRPKLTSDLHDYVIASAELKDGQTIWDAGCGLGGPGTYFASKLDAVIFSWTNSEYTFRYFSDKIAQIRSQLKGKIYPSLSDYHTVANIFPEKRFDRVLFLESFLHTSTPLQLLKSVHRVLKDDGILYLKEICTEHPDNSPQKEKIERAVEIGAEHFKYHYLSVDQLKQLLDEAGFKVLMCQKPQFENYIDLGDQYLKEVVHLDFFDQSEPVNWSDCFEFKCIKKKSV